MKRYSTISVPEEVKKTLEQAKGEKEWGDFLLDLHTKATTAKRIKAFEELVGRLSNADLESITRSSREFREGLKLR